MLQNNNILHHFFFVTPIRKIHPVIFVFIFLSSFIKIQAQINYNWYPVHPNTQYNYKADTSLLPFSVVIKIDSITNSPGSVFHLNKIVSHCDSCKNNLLLNDPYDSTYVLIHQPQFLQRTFKKLGDSAFYFRGLRSFVIKPFQATGVSWIFDSIQNISAIVLTRTVQSVLGMTDSVCVIGLSTLDTLLLSKNYGIIRFPFKTITSHRYTLLGMEGSVNAGVRLKRFHDFFDFNVSDILQYSFKEDDYNSFPPIFRWGRERWDFLSVSVSTNSVLCMVRKTVVDSSQLGGNPAIGMSFSQTVQISFIDSANHLANLYPMQEIMVNPFFVINNGIRAIHKVIMGVNGQMKQTKSFGPVCPSVFLNGDMTGAASQTPFTDVYLNQNSARIVGRQLTEGLGFTSELFNNYDRISQRCLTGYVKGVDTVGSIDAGTPLSVKSNGGEHSSCTIYPVPASHSFSIKGPMPEGTKIFIVNSIGNQIYDAVLSNTASSYQIPVEELANGLYFIIISNPYFSDIKKLTIQH